MHSIIQASVLHFIFYVCTCHSHIYSMFLYKLFSHLFNVSSQVILTVSPQIILTFIHCFCKSLFLENLPIGVTEIKVSVEPGVVTVKDIALPREGTTVQEDDNIEELEEYSGTFEVEVNQKDIEKYLMQQNVITTQSRSVHKNFTKTANLPDYYDVII